MSDDRLRNALLAAALIDAQERENERLRQEEEEEEKRARRKAEEEEEETRRAARNGEPEGSARARPPRQRTETEPVVKLVEAGVVIIVGIYTVGRFLVRKVRGK